MTTGSKPGMFLTPEVKAVIGAKGKVTETYGVVDREYLRRFGQAVMDPDPHFWDDDFAKKSRFGEVTTPPIMVSYFDNRIPPGSEDPVIRAFMNDPQSDGIGGLRGEETGLPPIPTPLVRILNAGNDIEVFKYPSIGDKIYCQASYASIVEQIGRDGTGMLLCTTETKFWNQRGEVLCITRGTLIRR